MHRKSSALEKSALNVSRLSEVDIRKAIPRDRLDIVSFDHPRRAINRDRTPRALLSKVNLGSSNIVGEVMVSSIAKVLLPYVRDDSNLGIGQLHRVPTRVTDWPRDIVQFSPFSIWSKNDGRHRHSILFSRQALSPRSIERGSVNLTVEILRGHEFITCAENERTEPPPLDQVSPWLRCVLGSIGIIDVKDALGNTRFQVRKVSRFVQGRKHALKDYYCLIDQLNK